MHVNPDVHEPGLLKHIHSVYIALMFKLDKSITLLHSFARLGRGSELFQRNDCFKDLLNTI
jgi:hypothetical protein